MVHGLGGAAVNWLAVGPELAKHHRTFALDLAGFGRTPLFHRSAALGANAELVHRFIEDVIGEPVILMTACAPRFRNTTTTTWSMRSTAW